MLKHRPIGTGNGNSPSLFQPAILVPASIAMERRRILSADDSRVYQQNKDAHSNFLNNTRALLEPDTCLETALPSKRQFLSILLIDL
ncbi:hypothetical protein GV64_01145 [Endozoicomonas elysicola]|uniref:Uncharacterized protein n=1 Tax=Endozoicomonas elysicola TaxID=305900 RepID=A0A081K5V3_9GAMM|nr:hypothetical protein GV64_01145 [Endozoicomonas elysicola]